MRPNALKDFRSAAGFMAGVVFWVALLQLLSVQGLFSEEGENYYALSSLQIKGKSGAVYEMHIITRVFDEATCKKIAEEKSAPIGRWGTERNNVFIWVGGESAV